MINTQDLINGADATKCDRCGILFIANGNTCCNKCLKIKMNKEPISIDDFTENYRIDGNEWTLIDVLFVVAYELRRYNDRAEDLLTILENLETK